MKQPLEIETAPAAEETTDRRAKHGPSRGFGSFLRRRFRGFAVDAWPIIALVLAWELVPRLVDFRWLPPLSEVGGALYLMYSRGELVANLVVSLGSLLTGFLMALTLGVVVGTLMGRFELVYRGLNVYVEALLFTPGLILAPVFFAIFGLGSGTRIAVVFIYALPVIIINASTAMRVVERSWMEMARAYGASQYQQLRLVALPAALPISLEGIRLGFGRAIKGMINGEVLIALVGLGGLASSYGARGDTASVWSITLLVASLALFSNYIFAAFERRVTYWVD